MVSPAEKELPREARVVRLAKDIPKFVPTGQPPLNGEVFAPSSDDEQEAIERNLPVRVSAWDLSEITAIGASVFRNLSGQKIWTLEMNVSQIANVATEFELSRVRVVSDPLQSDLPGATAHCGIEGLDRRPGESKKQIKAARDELARVATTSFIVGRAA